jgi:hypothetical protein
MWDGSMIGCSVWIWILIILDVDGFSPLGSLNLIIISLIIMVEMFLLRARIKLARGEIITKEYEELRKTIISELFTEY